MHGCKTEPVDVRRELDQLPQFSQSRPALALYSDGGMSYLSALRAALMAPPHGWQRVTMLDVEAERILSELKLPTNNLLLFQLVDLFARSAPTSIELGYAGCQPQVNNHINHATRNAWNITRANGGRAGRPGASRTKAHIV